MSPETTRPSATPEDASPAIDATEGEAAHASGATLGGNAAITISTQIAVLVFGLLASMLISRALGPEGRGLYYVPVTTVTVTFALLHLSLEMSVTYHYAERLESLRRLARVAATLALVMGLLGVVALTLPWLLDEQGQVGHMRTRDLALAALALPFVIHSAQLMNLFTLSGRLPRSQVVVVLVAVAQTIALVTLGVADLLTVQSVLAIYVATAILNWLFLLLWSWRFAPSVPTTDRTLLRRVIGHGVRLHTAFIAFFLLLRSDVFLVNAMLDARQIGLYSLVVLFAELVWTVASSLALAALPFQTVASAEEAGQATLRTVRVCLLVAGSLALGCVATLWWFLPFFYGREFAPVYGPMVVLLPGVVAMTIVRPLWNWLLREGRSVRIVVLFVGGFALNLVLNVLLLPAIGLYGASVASSLSYGLIAVVLSVWTLRNTGGRPRDLLPGREELDAALGLLGRLRRRTAAGSGDGTGPAVAG